MRAIATGCNDDATADSVLDRRVRALVGHSPWRPLLVLSAAHPPRVGAPGAGKLGGEHDWKDGGEPVVNGFAWVMCDADADTAIEERVRLVPHATDGPQAAMRAVGVPFGHGVNHCIRFVLARMEVTLIVAGLAQRLVLVPTFLTLPRPDGVAVNEPAAGVSIRLGRRTLSDVEPVSST